MALAYCRDLLVALHACHDLLVDLSGYRRKLRENGGLGSQKRPSSFDMREAIGACCTRSSVFRALGRLTIAFSRASRSIRANARIGLLPEFKGGEIR